MAHFFPPRPGPDTPRSELETWRALERLPDRWRVFHSVAWQVPKRSRVFDGEADFVLVHPRHGLVVLEVKGGLLEIRDGVWFQRNVGGGPWHELPRTPFEQAKGAAYDLHRYLTGAVPGLVDLPTARAVVLPAVSHPGDLGPAMPAAMTISRDELPAMEEAIDRLVAHARLSADLSTEQVEAITGRLAPTVRIPRRLGTAIAEVDRRLIELTEGQTRVLDLLRRHRRALITGGAGTGKTVLAIERAHRLAADGARVLLTCFNRPLGDHLAEITADVDGVTAMNFHHLGRHLFADAGLDVPDNPPASWFDEDLPELLLSARDRSSVTFDAIVVDEGQDFRPAWFVGLQMLLEDPDDGPFYVFADLHQAIYVDDWEPPFDDEPFPLDVNCRNTVQIAEKVAAVMGDEPLTLGVEGLAPAWVVADSPADRMAVLEEAVERLLTEEGIRPDQITILGSHRAPVEAERGHRVAGVAVGPLGSGGLVVETIHRFKGLENDVVFVVLDEVETERHRALAYVGMSRARAMLVVVGSREARAALAW